MPEDLQTPSVPDTALPPPAASAVEAAIAVAHPAERPAGITGGRPTRFPAVDADTIRDAFESGRYPYARPLGTRPYETERARLEAELLKV
jgi:hypothetical protein